MMRKALLVGLVLAALTSCKSSVDQDFSAKTDYPTAQSPWWKALEDPLLDQFATQLNEENLDLQAAQARLAEARALRRASKADLLPQIDVAGGSSRSNRRAAQPSTISDIGFDTAWEIDLFGKTRAAIKAAAAREEQAVADRDALRNTLLGDLARALVEWRQAREKADILGRLLQAQDTQIELYTAREKAGLIDGSLAERARAQRTQSAVQLPLLRAAATRAQYQIEYLLGLKPRALDKFFAEEHTILVHVPQADPVLAESTARLRQRPDIRAALAALEATKADVAQAEAALWPSVSLQNFFGVQNVSGFTAGNPAWSLGAALTGPLLHFGQLQAAIDVADARQNQAMITYQNTVLQALQETQTALSDYLNGMNATLTQEQALTQRTTALRLAQERFERGLNDMIDMTTAQQDQENAALGIVDQKAAAAIAFIRLQKSLAE